MVKSNSLKSLKGCFCDDENYYDTNIVPGTANCPACERVFYVASEVTKSRLNEPSEILFKKMNAGGEK